MNIPEPNTIDACQAALYAAQWSAGDIAIYQGIALSWQVYATRGDEKVFARAESRLDAWQQAVKLAANL
jgi:hypothetical protein